MSEQRLRNIFISIFCVIWIIIFHYESTRALYLQPFFNRPLPQLKLLFPPAGWIMFYNVDDAGGFAEIYGVYKGQLQLIDPHDIIQTRTIAYDNIHRNVLSEVASRENEAAFCGFLRRKFPDFDSFIITAVFYPSFTRTPHQKNQQVMYQCSRH